MAMLLIQTWWLFRLQPVKIANQPIAIGAKYLITSQWSVGFELSLRYTLSDYIDDVSTTYYLPSSFSDPVALELQDRALNPSLGWTGVEVKPNGNNEISNPRDSSLFETTNVSIEDYKIKATGSEISIDTTIIEENQSK